MNYRIAVVITCPRCGSDIELSAPLRPGRPRKLRGRCRHCWYRPVGLEVESTLGKARP